jgi:hypothetical protein
MHSLGFATILVQLVPFPIIPNIYPVESKYIILLDIISPPLSLPVPAISLPRAASPIPTSPPPEQDSPTNSQAPPTGDDEPVNVTITVKATGS